MHIKATAALATLAVCCTQLCPTHVRAAEPPAPAPWCVGLVDDDASSKVEAHWRTRWLAVGKHWYSAYVFGPQPINPFDLKAKAAFPPPGAPPSAPVSGFIWVSGVSCVMSAGSQPNETVVRITARVISFIEKSRWSPAQNDVLLLDVSFGAPGDRRRVVDRSADTGVIAPDMIQRLPAMTELPKAGKNGKLPCKPTETWTSNRCVR